MSRSDEGKISLQVDPPLFRLALLDSRFREIAFGFGEVSRMVRPGLYLARCEFGGPSEDQIVKVTAGQKLDIAFDAATFTKMPTAALVYGAAGARDEYSTLISQLGDTTTRGPLDQAAGARLIMFASRLADHSGKASQTQKPISWRSVRLRDATGQSAFSLPGGELFASESGKTHFAAVAIEMPPGNYVVEWPGAGPGSKMLELQPVSLCAGWTTIMYAAATSESSTPSRSTVSIQMARHGEHLDPQDRTQASVNTAAELALATLRTGRCQLSDRHFRKLLAAKFQNPMLGLLGAHALLLEQTPNTRLLRSVVSNLRNLIGECPDVIALQFLIDRHAVKGLPDNPAPVRFPPMLRSGLLGLSRAEWLQREGPGDEHSEILSGVARLARLRDLPDTPWTAFWHPKEVDRAENDERWQLSADAGAIPKFNAVPSPGRKFNSSGQEAASGSNSLTPFHRARLQAINEAELALAQYMKQVEAHAAGRTMRPGVLGWAGLSRLHVAGWRAAAAKSSDKPQRQPAPERSVDVKSRLENPWTARTWQIVHSDLDIAHVMQPLTNFTFEKATGSAGMYGMSGYRLVHNVQAPAPDAFADALLIDAGTDAPTFFGITGMRHLPSYSRDRVARYVEVSEKMNSYLVQNPSVQRLEGAIRILCHAHGARSIEGPLPDHAPMFFKTPIEFYQFPNTVDGDLPLLVVRAPLSPVCPTNGNGMAIGFGR